MYKYITRRLIRALITLIVFQTILFMLIQALPRDYASLVRISPAHRDAIRAMLGLDQPVWKQYLKWIGRFIGGDLGFSFAYRTVPVSRILTTRAPRTLLLFLPAALGGFALGLWLGKHIAWRRGSWLELGATLGGTASYTSFAPWLAFMMINVFALSLGWAPPENVVNPNVWIRQRVLPETVIIRLFQTMVMVGLLFLLLWLVTRTAVTHRTHARLAGGGLIIGVAILLWLSSGWIRLALDILHHMVLPLMTLMLLSFGETMLLMRTTMVDVLGRDHVLTARAKGIPDGAIRDRHVARLALLPVLTHFIVHLPFVIIGSFVVELVFSWRGMGQALFDAADMYDLPVLMGILSVSGVVILFAHLVLDVLNAWLDPRVRDDQFQAMTG